MLKNHAQVIKLKKNSSSVSLQKDLAECGFENTIVNVGLNGKLNLLNTVLPYNQRHWFVEQYNKRVMPVLSEPKKATHCFF